MRCSILRINAENIGQFERTLMRRKIISISTWLTDVRNKVVNISVPVLQDRNTLH